MTFQLFILTKQRKEQIKPRIFNQLLTAFFIFKSWLKFCYSAKYSIHETRSTYKVVMYLTIKSFNLADRGTYNCVSTNSLGRAEGTLRLYSELTIYFYLHCILE